MAKRTASENLRSFSIIYIVLSVLYIGAVILCSLIPDVANMLKASYGNDIMIKLIIGVAVSVIGYLWYFWLARRVADGKSNGTLYMVLLILGIVGSIISFFTVKGYGFLSLDAIVDICGLYFLYQVRKEK